MQKIKGDKILNWERKPNEKRYAYIYRIYSNQDLIGDNETLGALCREQLNETYDESAYRKAYQSFSLMFEEIKDQLLTDKQIDILDEKMDLLFKQQVKTRDQLREKRKTLRDEARIEVLIDAVRESAKSYPEIKPIYPERSPLIKDGNEANLLIGDWHVADCFENFRNSFNVEILEKRVQTLMEKTVAYCKMANVTKLNCINLGDCVSGNIHTSIRVEAELNMVEQVKKASALIYQLLMYLSEALPDTEILYRSTLDNHSRMNKDYKEHVEKESFASLMDWWLESKLEGTRIQMPKDNIDPNIGHFVLNNGKNFFFVHGHLDNINSAIQDLTFGTNIICDILAMGHWHTEKTKSFQGKKLVVNSSLKGTDSYGLSKRLFGTASQTLLIFNEEDTIEVRIQL